MDPYSKKTDTNFAMYLAFCRFSIDHHPTECELWTINNIVILRKHNRNAHINNDDWKNVYKENCKKLHNTNNNNSDSNSNGSVT